MITKEEVLAKAKESGLTLKDEEIAAYVLIGRLPEKAAGTGSPTGDKGHDSLTPEEEAKLGEGAKQRIQQLIKQRNEIKEQLEAQAKILKQLQDAQADVTRKESEKKGEYEKLLGELNTQKTALADSLVTLKNNLKDTAVKSKVETALFAAGIPQDRLPKALKLFDLAKVGFTWVNEAKLEYEIGELKDQVEAFKKDNIFLFNEKENPNPAYAGNRPGQSKQKTDKSADEIKRLEDRFPALKNF